MMDNDDINIADKDFQRETEILKLLAKERSIKRVADQFGEDEKYITRLKSRACKYPIRVLAEMPPIVQDYIIDLTREERPKLAQELAAFKAGTVGSEQIAKDQHFNELAEASLKVAEFFASFWPYDERDATSIAEEAVNTGDYEFTRFMDQETGLLFAHMQADFPDLIFVKSFCELQVKNLNKELVEKLRLRSQKKEFIGHCEGCP